MAVLGPGLHGVHVSFHAEVGVQSDRALATARLQRMAEIRAQCWETTRNMILATLIAARHAGTTTAMETPLARNTEQAICAPAMKATGETATSVQVSVNTII